MESLCKIRPIHGKAKPSARCRRNTTKPIKKRPDRFGGNGFLNYRFKPFWLFKGNEKRAEREFFRSLKNLCQYYDLKLPEIQELSFPENIYRAWSVTAERVKAIDKNLQCLIIQDSNHEAAMATAKQFDTGRTLYYIPVKPLWNWVSKPQHQQVAEVVTAIFAYLYQIAGVPMYAEYDTFLADQYRYVEEMINEDMNEEDADENAYRESQLDELYTLQNSGIHLLRLMSDKERLKNLDNIILKYANLTQRDNELAILAIEFVQLYRAYPGSSVFDNIRPDLFYPNVTERVKAEEYISFYWSGSDTIIETVMSMIDCSFQEMGITDEPVNIQIFDKPISKELECFGFESRFFPLLDRLCVFLNQYDN